ncbi:MAG: aspartate/tyrosine/aromatic aminotransferase, partial [Cryobacterium sp.]|nr:aspartate/tyrosine/aromatic aminotransferase [Oligoflexia bacterium]
MKTHPFTLTELENLGLLSQFNFADGHADPDLQSGQTQIIRQLPEIWFESASISIREQEKRYLKAFADLANSPSFLDYSHFRICPTASNSIDIVGAWLAHHQMRVALIEPT